MESKYRSIKFIFLSLMTVFPSLILAADPAPAAAKAKGDWSPMLGILLMFAVFFFLIIMPQSRKAKKQAAFLSSLKRGDDVVTSAGIYGRIYGITDRVVTLEVANNVRIRVDRQTIAGLAAPAVDASGTSNVDKKAQDG